MEGRLVHSHSSSPAVTPLHHCTYRKYHENELAQREFIAILCSGSKSSDVDAERCGVTEGQTNCDLGLDVLDNRVDGVVYHVTDHTTSTAQSHNIIKDHALDNCTAKGPSALCQCDVDEGWTGSGLVLGKFEGYEATTNRDGSRMNVVRAVGTSRNECNTLHPFESLCSNESIPQQSNTIGKEWPSQECTSAYHCPDNIVNKSERDSSFMNQKNCFRKDRITDEETFDTPFSKTRKAHHKKMVVIQTPPLRFAEDSQVESASTRLISGSFNLDCGGSNVNTFSDDGGDTLSDDRHAAINRHRYSVFSSSTSTDDEELSIIERNNGADDDNNDGDHDVDNTGLQIKATVARVLIGPTTPKLPHSHSTHSLPSSSHKASSQRHRSGSRSGGARPRSKTFGGERLPTAPRFRPKSSSIHPTNLKLPPPLSPASFMERASFRFSSPKGVSRVTDTSIDAHLARMVHQSNCESFSSRIGQQ